MCGRFTHTATTETIAQKFQVENTRLFSRAIRKRGCHTLAAGFYERQVQ